MRSRSFHMTWINAMLWVRVVLVEYMRITRYDREWLGETHLVTPVEYTSEEEDKHEDAGIEEENGRIGFVES